jgi:hypothetical protein
MAELSIPLRDALMIIEIRALAAFGIFSQAHGQFPVFDGHVWSIFHLSDHYGRDLNGEGRLRSDDAAPCVLGWNSDSHNADCMIFRQETLKPRPRSLGSVATRAFEDDSTFFRGKSILREVY